MMGLRKSKKSNKVSTTFYAGEVEIHLRGVLSFINSFKLDRKSVV